MARRTASGRLSGAPLADGGYALAALLTGLAVMGIMTSMALPVWSQATRREREIELIFRGEQYARAVELYQRVYAGAHPPDIETLIEERFLRRRYRDPMVADGEFRIVYQTEVDALLGDGAAASERAGGAGGPGQAAGRGAVRRTSGSGASPVSIPARGDSPPAENLRGGVAGVVSRSTDASIRIYNGRTKYNEWVFVYGASEDQPGRPAVDGFESAPQPEGGGVAPGGVGNAQRFGPARPRSADRPQ